jgi:hypothetical protein
MKRTFPNLFKINTSNNSQPLCYTTLTANVNPFGTVPVFIPVATSTNFRIHDRVVLDPGLTMEETTEVISIPGNANFTAILKNSHNNNNFVGLHFACATVYCQPTAGNTGPIYIGNNAAMSNNAYVIEKLTNVAANAQPYDFSDNQQGSGINPLNTKEYFGYGTANDTYTVALGYI